MRVSRFTQFSLVAIATLSAVALGILGGAALREDSATGVAPTPIELLSQDLNDTEDIDTDSQRSQGQLLNSLNLSRRQKRQLFAIRNQYRPDIRDQRQALRAEMAQLRQLMISDVPASEVSAQFTQVQNIRRALNEANFESSIQIREVLTLEQRQIFSEQLQARRQSRGRKRFLEQP